MIARRDPHTTHFGARYAGLANRQRQASRLRFVWVVGGIPSRVVYVMRCLAAHGPADLGREPLGSLGTFGISLTVVLAIAYGVGIAAARGFGSDWLDLTGFVYPIVLGVVAFVVFSMTAYGLSVWRYYAYGVLVAVAPIVGEGLRQNDLVDHHGFSIAFGTVALIMLITGIVRFSTVLRSPPVPIHPQVS